MPGQSSIDRISTDLISTEATQAAIARAAYTGFSDLLALLQAGAPASEILLSTSITVGTLIGTGVAGVFPLAGAAITIFTSFLGGLIGGSNSNPQQALFDAIMKEVELMINRNNLAVKLQSVQNKLLAIGDELSWVPDVLEETPEATQIAWMLTVQHSLELSWRDVFGDCVQDAAGTACRDWQRAGTVDLGVKFAGMHLILLANMAASNTSSVGMSTLLQARMEVVAQRYAPLMFNSFDTYSTYRLAAMQITSGYISPWMSPNRPCPDHPRTFYGAWIKVTDTLAEADESTVFERKECVEDQYPYTCHSPLDGCEEVVTNYWRDTGGLAEAERARDERKVVIQTALADVSDQIEILVRAFPPTPIAPAVCNMSGRRGTQSSCNTLLQACKDTAALGKGKTGCEMFMHGWGQQDNSNVCVSCSTTTRAFGCHDMNECNEFCTDIYQDAQDEMTCKAGCEVMNPYTRFGSSVKSWCAGRP